MRACTPGKDTGMKHTPFGYDIVDGMAVVNETEAEQLQTLFAGYLLGLSLKAAGAMAGIKTTHGQIKRMLQNRKYLGDEYYPQIMDAETFEAVNLERKRREKLLGRSNLPSKGISDAIVYTRFSLGDITKKYSDPYKQAEYIYSQIKEVGV